MRERNVFIMAFALFFVTALLIFSFEASASDPSREDLINSGESNREEFSLSSFCERTEENNSNCHCTISKNEESAKVRCINSGKVRIRDKEFNNLNPDYSEKATINKGGNITAMYLVTNGSGSIFQVNGVNFSVGPNSSFDYNKSGEISLEDTEIKGDLSNFRGSIRGTNVDFPDGFRLDRGEVKIKKSEKGKYYETVDMSRAEYSYKGTEILSRSDPGEVVNTKIFPEDYECGEEKCFDDTRNMGDNIIRKTPSGFNVYSSEKGSVSLNFRNNKEIFNMDREGYGSLEQNHLETKIAGGDFLSLSKREDVIEGMPPLIDHEPSKGGMTVIENGRHVFELKNGKLNHETGKLHTKNWKSSEMDLQSKNIGGKVLQMDEKNEYSIYDLEKRETMYSFDKSLFERSGHEFKSEEGRKIYEFVEDKVGRFAFGRKGKGDVYYDEDTGERKKVPGEVKGYDCIGLAQKALSENLGGSPKNYPPNLRLKNVLKERGWKTRYVEPKDTGNEDVTNEVKSIPSGSIVFLMHPQHHAKEENIDGSEMGTKYETYKNSQGEKKILDLGHTLIKGTGEKSFINSIPTRDEEIMPRTARIYNKRREEKGMYPLFEGTVKEGELVPENDYLLVLSPPEG